VRLRIPHDRNVVADARKGARQAYFPEVGGFVETIVFNRYLMAPGTAIEGPAIAEERESTVVVGPTARAHLDDHWNVIVELA